MNERPAGSLLPGERELCEQLQVSRPVLREALLRLSQEGWLAIEPRRGYRIQRSGQAQPPMLAPEVHVLSPQPTRQLRLFTNLWLDELRKQLHEVGQSLIIHDGAQYFARRPAHALQQLVRRQPRACWVLVHGVRETQEWFAAQDLPCIVAGTVHQGLSLPSMRIEVQAVARHAAGILVRHGHQRIGFLNISPHRAGDSESERAFLEGAAAAGKGAVEATILHHHPRPDSLDLVVRRLVAQRERITGLLVGHSYTYLTVLSLLGRLGLRVPEDISLISREDDPFLSALVPLPARYTVNPALYARRLHRALQSLAARPPLLTTGGLTPEFIKGASVGPPPAR